MLSEGNHAWYFEMYLLKWPGDQIQCIYYKTEETK